MKRLIQATAVSALLAGLPSVPAQAITYTQVGSTGQTLDNAQVIPGGASPLDSINGTLSSPNTVNLFQIFLTGGLTFSATTITPGNLLELPVDQALGIPTSVLADPQLFLFDATGRGVYGSDDSFGTLQATLPSNSFSPAQSGTYYLAIASSGYNPVSNNGEIFSANAAGLLEPTGPGAASPLSGFTGQGSAGGDYQIGLTGVTVREGVPEPNQTLGLIAVGALGIIYRLKRRKA